jgi:hypothetical protein
MRILIIYLALFAGQMNTLQDKHVVRLHPNQDSIPIEFGGDLVEFINAPPVVQLPKLPPRLDSQGSPWSVEVKNLGPGAVKVVGNAQFSMQVNVGRTVLIKSTGTGYSALQ